MLDKTARVDIALETMKWEDEIGDLIISTVGFSSLETRVGINHTAIYRKHFVSLMYGKDRFS